MDTLLLSFIRLSNNSQLVIPLTSILTSSGPFDTPLKKSYLDPREGHLEEGEADVERVCVFRRLLAAVGQGVHDLLGPRRACRGKTACGGVGWIEFFFKNLIALMR